MMNICSELRCPHALRNGCDQFTVSNHCPVAIVSHDIKPNQYWLFGEEDANLDVNQLRDVLVSEVLDGESSHRRLWARANMDEGQPVMVWEK